MGMFKVYFKSYLFIYKGFGNVEHLLKHETYLLTLLILGLVQ